MNKLNPHLSVDCVVFGFESGGLKVLLIEREKTTGPEPAEHRLKLPGNLIFESEDLDSSAIRTLRELTGLENIFLRQFGVFDSPGRLSPKEDLAWLRLTSGMEIDRVVTIAYYSLIKIAESNRTSKTVWQSVSDLPGLLFDHNQIIQKALQKLRADIRTKPLCFELLPKKFTIRQMQDVYEAILDEDLDNRNFRKKVIPLEFLIPLPEKERGVNHKPAVLYRFDKKLYEKHKKLQSGFYL